MNFTLVLQMHSCGDRVECTHDIYLEYRYINSLFKILQCSHGIVLGCECVVLENAHILFNQEL